MPPRYRMFQGTKRCPNDLEIYEHQFYEGRRLGSEGSKRAEAWGPPSGASWLRCRQSFCPRLHLDLKPTIKIPPNVDREEVAANRETPKQRPGPADRRGKTPVERCQRGLHLPQQRLQRLHDEEGVVHPWTMGLWK